MDDKDSKYTFAKNLQYQMDLHGKSRRDVCEALGFNYNTFTDWVRGKKFPRMGAVEKLANYFGILKSELIEEQTEEMRQQKKDNKIIANLAIRMQKDESFFEAVKAINELEPEKINSLLALLK